MNPELVKALRQLLKARKQIADLTPDEEEAFVREETKGKYGVAEATKLLESIDSGISSENIARSITQGGMFNTADEIVKGVNGDAAGEEFRLKDELFRSKHPYASGAAAVAGGVGTGLATGGLLPAVTVGGRVASAATNGAIGGGVYGALAGAGDGEGSGRLATAARGLGVGAALGGGLGAVLGKYLNTFDPAARGDRRLTNIIKKSGGKVGIDRELASANKAGVGKDIVMADVTPHATKGLRFGVNNNVDTEVAAEELLFPRRAGMAERLSAKLKKALGPVNLPQLKQSLHDSHQSWADGAEGYGGLRNAETFVDPSKLSEFVAKPTIAEAWKRARLSGDLKEGEPLDKMIQQILANNPGGDPAQIGAAIKGGIFGQQMQQAASQSRPITFADMQSLKRALDGRVTNAVNNGDVNLVQSYKTIRDGVRGVMLEAWPGYNAVDSKYEAFMRVEDALQDGQKAMEKFSADDLALEVAKLKAMDKQRPGFGFLKRFREGAQGHLQDKLDDIKTNRNASAEIVNASKTMREKLKVIFGDDSKFNWFMDTAKWEMKMNRSVSTLGNSVTHRLGNEAHADPAGDLTGAQLTTPSGIKHWLAEHTIGPSIERANSEAAQHVGRSLLTQGSPAIEAEVIRLLHPQPLINTALRGLLSGGSGAVAGR